MKKYLTSRLAMLAMSGGRSTFQKSRSFCAATVGSSSALSSNICRGKGNSIQQGDYETSKFAKVRFQLYSLMVSNDLPFYGFYCEATVSSWLLKCSRSPPMLSPRPLSGNHQLCSGI